MDPSDPDVASIVPKLRRGYLNQMSFGFRVSGDDGDEWNDDMSKRTLRTLDIHDGDDVSVVTYPANPGTMAAVRGDDTTALDALVSALRAMEARKTSREDVNAVLARALSGLSLAPGDDPAPVVAAIQDLDVPFEDGERAASIAREARERALRLIG